jgi:coenzyme F420-reducing hydrogenase gamma subunit
MLNKNKPKTNKPKVAITSLTCCEGCEFAILDLGEKFLDLSKYINLKEFHLIEEMPEKGKYDIAFVEGVPLRQDQLLFLQKIRKKSKILVALGACATQGGVQEIKNHHQKEVKPEFVYPNIKKIENPKVVPLSSVVKVDFEIQGCPISGDDFLRIVYQLLAKKTPKYPERPVCYECQINKYECLLQKGKPCLGPMSLGGCSAICLSGKLECQGCRGPLKELNLENIKKALAHIISEKEFYHLLEIYGIRDKVESQEHKNKITK